jgi:hypothetical protein
MASRAGAGSFALIAMFMVFIVFWILMLLLNLVQEKHDDDSLLFVRTIMRSKIMNAKDFEQYLSGVQQMAPIIELSGTCLIPQGKRGGLVSFKEVYPYVSWEERSKRFKSRKSGMVAVHLVCDCHLTSSLHQKAFDECKAHLKLVQTIHFNAKATSEVRGIVPEMLEYLLVSFDGKVPGFVAFFNSCFGGFIWFLCRCFGFGALVESLFCKSLDVMEVKFEKYLSDAADFRCPSGELDLSFCIEGDGHGKK